MPFLRRSIQHDWKDTISGVHVSPGSAETLIRRGGITIHHLIAYFLSNISSRNYQNRLMCVEVIVCRCFKTQCGQLCHGGVWCLIGVWPLTRSIMPVFSSSYWSESLGVCWWQCLLLSSVCSHGSEHKAWCEASWQRGRYGLWSEGFRFVSHLSSNYVVTLT